MICATLARAVLVRDVLDDLAAPALAEVDVDVGQRDALGVQEALEDEVVLDRIDVGDAQAVGDEAAGRRAAARTDRNALLARVADEIPRDQEVPGVLHLLDHVDFVGEPALVLVDGVLQHPASRQLLQPRQPLREPLAHDVLEVVVEREARRHVEVRQVVDRARQVDVAALGDPHGVRQRVGEVLEDRRHLLAGLQVELVAVIVQPLGVVDRLAGADAQQDVVRLEVGVLQVVDVVGDDEREPEVPRDRLQPDVDRLLLVDPLVLHLEEEIVRPENVAIGGGGVERLLLLLGPDAGRDLPLQAAAQADQPVRVLGEQLLVDARLVVEALGVARRHQLDEVVVPLVGLGEQHQVVGRLAGRPALRAPVAGRDVDLAAEDRVDPALARLVVEDDRREHVAVLGDRHRRHLQLDRVVEQLLDAARAVEQRVLEWRCRWTKSVMPSRVANQSHPELSVCRILQMLRRSAICGELDGFTPTRSSTAASS